MPPRSWRPSETTCRFLIVGEPSPIKNRAYVDELEARAARLGIASRVIFTGLRSDVPALLSAVDVSVMPSLNEALSNVLLESMAAGAAVVATDVGGTAEALVNGKNGLLIPPANPQAMAAAMLHLIDNAPLARELGNQAKRTISDRFSLDRMVTATGIAVRRPVVPQAVEGGMSAIAVDVINDYSTFVDLEPKWNETVDRAGLTHPFLRHEWLRTWWDSFGQGRTLNIVVVRAGNRILGLAPLMLERARMYGIGVRRIQFLHNDHTPKADVVVVERADEVYEALWKTLQSPARALGCPATQPAAVRLPDARADCAAVGRRGVSHYLVAE